MKDLFGFEKAPYNVKCIVCGDLFVANRKDHRYCSATCRVKAFQKRDASFDALRDIDRRLKSILNRGA